MNKETFAQLFKSPYKRQAFIENGLLPAFQGKVSDLKIYDEHSIQPVELTASEKIFAVSAVKYGEFQTMDEIPRTVELFEVIVDDNKQIERSRVGLGALVKKHIIGNNAVLVNFAYQNPEKRSWRFSFIARDGVFQDGEMQITDTHPKRYTYVFGEPDETYKTALDRFSILGNELEITINKIKDAFGVEAMSKAFFDDYRDVHYAGFVDYLMRSNFKKSAFNGNDKDVRDFVKKLLGRIVFLYFLQKKGWLGAKDTSYKNGDKNFMANFFKKAGANEAFYPTWLSKLFFDALNNKRTNDDFTMPDGEVVKIPYLNGGLFERESSNYDFLTFPADLFSNLFEFFDQYNFTIFEDSPEEHTVAVDPEMLGHIFENLLEDNKDKGAFYTPKEIVHYMTQESLIEHLHTQIPDAEKTDLENFVKSKESNLSKEHKQQIDQKLDTVKICDPAIGSGAFPMGLLQEIFGLKERIAYDLGYKVWSPATVKENIIQNSIYGVDIERGAVDIARLRFWLSLIVDEEIPKALPNLDYKIVVGNSLVSKFDDEVIEIDWSTDNTKVGLFAQELVVEKINLLEKISEKQKRYFTAKIEEKQKLAKEIRLLKLDIISTQLKEMIEINDTRLNQNATQNKKQLEVTLKVAGWKKILTKIQHLKENPDRTFNHFDWKLDFPEVLNPLVKENTGFDIVIGNPPYIQLQKNGGELSKQFESIGFKTFARTGDIYSLFYEKGWQLLKSKGLLSFITSNKWMRAGYGESTRHFFAEHTNPILLIDFAGQKIFETATVDTNILLLSKDKNQQKTLACVVKEKVLNNLSVFVRQHAVECNFSSKESWTILSPIEQNIKRKIEAVGTPLKDWDINIYRGILTGYNEAFIIDGATKDKLIAEDAKSAEIIRPILRGKDIKRYGYDFADKWLINTHNGIKEKGIKPVNINDYPAIKEHLDSHWVAIEKRADQGDTPYNLRNCAYMDDFYKQKIMYSEIVREPQFYLDNDGEFFPEATSFIITGEFLEFLYDALHTKTITYFFKAFYAGGGLGETGFRYKKAFLELLPIPKPSKQYNRETIESEILKLYQLSKEEIEFIISQ